MKKRLLAFIFAMAIILPCWGFAQDGKFVWMTAPDKGQMIIRDFGKDKYGAPMFFPNSDVWRKKNGK